MLSVKGLTAILTYIYMTRLFVMILPLLFCH